MSARSGRTGERPAGVPVRVEGLTRNFSRDGSQKAAAVNNVSFTVAAGEFVTLLGPSGCGKTTTLRMIAGFERPDQGRVMIGAQDVTDRAVFRRNIGFVFQSYALFPHLTVFENVAYALRVKKLDEADIGGRVARVLQLVGLSGYEKRYPMQLSGGEQQRVAVARAVVMEPEVLLFDEPLSNLDAKLRVQMREELRRLQRTLAITTIYVTHDQEEAMAISDRIVVMERGAIAQFGSAEDLYFEPASEFVARFIGRVNALRVTVERRDGPQAVAQFLGTTIAVPTTEAWAAGEPAVLVIRPEALRIAAAGASPSLSGTVTSRTFLGERADYSVAVGETILQAVAYAEPRNAAFNPGDRVSLSWEPGAARLLRPAS